MTAAEIELERKIQQGREIAKLLMLRPDRAAGHDRYKTTWGNKTAFGIYCTIERLAEMMDTGEEIKS